MITPRSRFWTGLVLALIVWIAAMILGGRDSPVDIDFYRSLVLQGATPLARNAILFTELGGGIVLTLMAVLAAIYLAWRRRRRAGLLLFMIFAGRLAVELQKIIVDRPRPGVSPHLVAITGNSFPSGHAANAMITYLAIALLLPVAQRNRAIAVGIGLAVALQVGVSRVMLGVHWPSDVVGGWAFALVWIMVCMRLASARPDAEASRPAG